MKMKYRHKVSDSVTFILLVHMVIIIVNYPLTEAFNHVGETSPPKVEAAIGSNFNITCYMNPNLFDGKNCSNLYFDNGRTNEMFPQENIIIVNRTSIVYEVRNATEQDTKYRCKCGTVAIMQTRVFVGTLPKPITDFTCRSYHFEYMVCNFTKPINTVGTQYNITFYTTSVKYIYIPDCSASVDGATVVCNTSFHNYRPRDEYYHYRINAENALGKMEEQQIDVNNWEIMVPAKPDEKFHMEVLENGINVAWHMTNWEDYRPKGLEWEVLVIPENFTAIRCQNPDRPDKFGLMRLSITHLPYSYWPYQLKIRVKVNVPDAVWSEQLVRSFRTAARQPDRPPLLLPGSFYIDSMETSITIYWEQLAPHELNGYNFSYIITDVRCNGKSTNLKPVQLELNLATFMWNKDTRYEFEVRSHNHKGFSSEASYLIINPLGERNVKQYTPKAIHNVYHASNRTYTLSWKAPTNIENLLSYTVYWCYARRGLPNECKGSVHFHQLPHNQLTFTTETSLHEQTINLAVSADYSNINTGLHWTECSMDVNSDLVKMEPDIQATSATTVKVRWSVERVCQSILDGFNLTYCEIAPEATSENAPCAQIPTTKTLPKDWKRYEITELKPYTKYNITMLMFSRLKRGIISDAILVRTLEGTPSPPRQLHVLKVTNTSANIRWQPPSQRNGVIRKYTIILNTDKYEVNSSVLEYKLNNLAGFTAYKVYVLAHTVYSSMPSNDVHFTTLIGYPSPPGHSINSNNASLIQWTKPLNPRGHVDFYEINVTQMRNAEKVRSSVSVVMGDTSCNFKVPPCLSHEYKTIIEVRAVNVAPLNHEGDVMDKIEANNNEETFTENNNDDDDDDLFCKGGRLDKQSLQDLKRYRNSSQYRLYKSAWQSIATYACSSSRLSKIVTIVLLVVVMSLVVMVALYMARRVYNKMANINCTLPAGLDLYFTKDATTNIVGGGGNHSLSVVNVTGKILNSASQAAEEQWLVTCPMKDMAYRNEYHHLLASLGQDSGYLDRESGTPTSSLETANISEEGGEQLKQKCETSSCVNRSNDLQLCKESLGEISDTCNEDSVPAIAVNNYIPNSSVLLPAAWQTFADADTYETNTFAPGPGGYVIVQSLGVLTTKSDNPHPDYSTDVTTSSNNNICNTNGYSTVEDLAKRCINRDRCRHIQHTGVNITESVPMAGYVTQQGLSIFAQQQQ